MVAFENGDTDSPGRRPSIPGAVIVERGEGGGDLFVPTEVHSKASAACGATNKCGMTKSGGCKPFTRRKTAVSRLIVARFEYAE